MAKTLETPEFGRDVGDEIVREVEGGEIGEEIEAGRKLGDRVAGKI